MREIKFKAWDIKKKGWIQGFNMVNYHDYYNKGIGKSIYRYDTKWKEDEYILFEYIGRKDRNGIEIYDGHICRCKDYTVICEYNDDRAEYRFRLINTKNIAVGYAFYNQLEIIGHKSPNPELLT